MLESLDNLDVHRMSVDEPEQQDFFDSSIEMTSNDRLHLTEELENCWNKNNYTTYIAIFLALKKLDPKFDLQPKPEAAAKASQQILNWPSIKHNTSAIAATADLKELYPEYFFSEGILMQTGVFWIDFVNRLRSQRMDDLYARMVVDMKRLGYTEERLSFSEEDCEVLRDNLENTPINNDLGISGIAASLKILRPDQPVNLSDEQKERVLEVLESLREHGQWALLSTLLKDLSALKIRPDTKLDKPDKPLPLIRNF